MRYSTEPRVRIYVKGYGFLSCTRNIGKSLSNKYGQKLIDSANKSTTDAIKTASKRATDKIASVSKQKPDKELHHNDETDTEITAHKKRYIFPPKRQEIIDELRLAPKKDVSF